MQSKGNHYFCGRKYTAAAARPYPQNTPARNFAVFILLFFPFFFWFLVFALQRSGIFYRDWWLVSLLFCFRVDRKISCLKCMWYLPIILEDPSHEWNQIVVKVLIIFLFFTWGNVWFINIPQLFVPYQLFVIPQLFVISISVAYNKYLNEYDLFNLRLHLSL